MLSRFHHGWIDLLRWLCFWRYVQCCAEFRWRRGDITCYCVRRKGHFGKHMLNNGMDF